MSLPYFYKLILLNFLELKSVGDTISKNPLLQLVSK